MRDFFSFMRPVFVLIANRSSKSNMNLLIDLPTQVFPSLILEILGFIVKKTTERN